MMEKVIIGGGGSNIANENVSGGRVEPLSRRVQERSEMIRVISKKK